MPGYGLFNALAGVVAGFKSDLLTIGLSTIKLHVLLFALANAFFVANARRVLHPGIVLAAAALVAFLPNQLALTSTWALPSGSSCGQMPCRAGWRCR
jgi:hypothetical protein